MRVCVCVYVTMCPYACVSVNVCLRVLASSVEHCLACGECVSSFLFHNLTEQKLSSLQHLQSIICHAGCDERRRTCQTLLLTNILVAQSTMVPHHKAVQLQTCCT